ncbi:hypothetical protein G9A89_012465 [Geosiphon pyriformis]|nr:hypothetical protein G9A89_012465 [Geosiphon pyriformis]
MCLGKELSEYQKGGIISAIKLGHTNSEISTTIGCLCSSNKETCRQTLSQIRLNFIKNTNKSIFIQTIQNELAQEGLHSCIPRLKPLIFKSNKEKRLQWARTYENWTDLDVYDVNFPKTFIRIVLRPQLEKALVACFGDVFHDVQYFLYPPVPTITMIELLLTKADMCQLWQKIVVNEHML